MRKTFCLFSALSVCSTFSFYKMSDVILHKAVVVESAEFVLQPGDVTPPIIKHVNIPNNETLYLSQTYRYYIYNEKLKYGLKGGYNRNALTPERFELSKRRVFDRTWWENCFISDSFETVDLFPFKTNLPKKSAFEELNNQMESKGLFHCIPFKQSYPFKEILRLTSNICVHNSKEGIKLSDSKGQNINFEKAFKNYVRSHSSSYGEQLFEDVLKLKNDLKNSEKKPSFTNILKKSKMFFSEQEKDLLNRSDILAIWALPEKKYNNKEYIEQLNEKYKEAKYKTINRIIIGFAVDKRDNTTFHWVTDLGQDISVLFDYVDKPKGF